MNARDDKALASPSPKRPKAARAGQGAGALAPLFGTSTRTPPRSLAPVSAARQRKLHVGHFAFMRSVVQGLDPRESWERYFRVEGEATDQRTVRATIAWIRDEFAAAAKREDRFGTARLVRIDATRIADPSLELPSLEAFAEARGLEDERQADQIAAYEAEYGRATQRLRRRARLIARQLEALRWLESLVAQSPKAGDSVAAWLNPTLASHLEAADIFTLAQLVERINGVGRRWHAGIKAMGEGKALRIVEWLREHQDSIGLQLGRHVAMPRSKLYAHELQAVVRRPPTSARWRSSSCRPSWTAPAACTGARRRSAC
jgi:DNA-binding transcriptional ArsR family regulator